MSDSGTAIAMRLSSVMTGPDHRFGVAGETIFVGTRPSTPDRLICVTEYPGSAPTMPMGGGTAILRSPSVQVVIRGERTEDFDVVYDRAMDLWLYLQAILDQTIDGTNYLHITPTDDPALLDIDDDERVLIVMNFNTTKE